MSRQKVEELQQKVNALSQRYDARFANKPRATRNLEELDELIEGMEDAIKEGQRLLNGDNSLLREVLDTAKQNLERYTEERAAIARVKQEGPEVAMAANLAMWANFVFDEYHRHYAGKNRATRDIGRLEEMLAELESIQEDMLALLAKKPDLKQTKDDLAVVESNIEMYDSELENILSARTQGSRDEQASALANAANEQFTVYNTLFAGKGRTTRRPGLLERVIKNLKGILNMMRDLNSKGYRSESNTKNISIVQQNLKTYHTELAAIQEAREDASLEDLAGMLGGAANDVMEEYRQNFAGLSRATRDLDLLTALCDEMYEIALQMRQIQDAEPGLKINTGNLSIVADNLVTYHSEYRRIEEAKGQGS